MARLVLIFLDLRALDIEQTCRVSEVRCLKAFRGTALLLTVMHGSTCPFALRRSCATQAPAHHCGILEDCSGPRIESIHEVERDLIHGHEQHLPERYGTREGRQLS